LFPQLAQAVQELLSSNTIGAALAVGAVMRRLSQTQPRGQRVHDLLRATTCPKAPAVSTQFWDYASGVHVVALRNLESDGHRPGRSETEGALKASFAEAKSAQWTCPQDVKKQYANASIVANNRVVFNIKGDDHRLIVAIAYRMQYSCNAKFIGTHAEYDRADAAVVDQFKGV